ncbi:NADPH-dependent F420 reductase (plasmid) [Agrobacterium leguminum]|uniref:NADP oxidoreductase coenzyme F420-dependent n=1 Tax=Agrobacterium deltaense NCPPB 1641 TaxID=1183425 RepID=A0A1S7U9D8_9HYPH|nr:MULTISPECIES: NADPH-dependent F420 reductase [Agrobacterium]WFS70092.1 NADPH-dependent F420 reductase [Agrobacterium leguminum]CVI63483.1 NADP oxidoreductase coenzyme F420-dependent [Agrobacterium deltaense NCPPB 1641]
MKIAVIGTGNMGGALARALFSAKKEVVIGARDPANAAALAAEIGSQVEGGGIAAALKVADIAIVALPYDAAIAVLKSAGDLAGKIVVDISNPITADYKDLVLGHTTSAAEQLQAAAPTAKVVKAFNTVFAPLIPAEARQKQTVQVFVAGDDADATARIRELAQALAFEPQDAGPLSNSRFLEPIGEMNIHFGFFLGKGPTVAPAWVSVSN